MTYMYVKSIGEYLSAINKEKTSEMKIFFRGQSQDKWYLTPPIFRSKKRKKKEHKIYSQAMTECPQDFANCNNHCEILSTMQHYGIPTRLLDVTKNALVALYFAVVDDKGIVSKNDDGVVYIIGAPKTHIKEYDSDTISILASLPRFSQKEQKRIRKKADEALNDKKREIFNYDSDVHRLLHEIKKEKPQFEPIISPKDVMDNFIFTPKKTNPRIIRQQGAFIIFGLKHKKIRCEKSLIKNAKSKNKIHNAHRPVILNKIKISKKHKKDIYKDLKTCGITQTSLFPELYKYGEFIVNKYKPDEI